MIKMEIQQITSEVLVIGSGPAGLTAALYCSRSGLKTVVLQGKASSRMFLDYPVENYPGFVSIQSNELLERFRQHALHFGAEIIEADAIDINLSMNPKFVATKSHLLEAKAVIIATGRPSKRKQSIPGEEKFVGLGVSYCATCDGPLYRGKKVLAVGNDDEAAEDVLALRQMGVEVDWISGENKEPEISTEMLNEIKAQNLDLPEKTTLREIMGEDKVEKVILEEAGEEKTQEIAGVFLFKQMPFSSLFNKSGVGIDHRSCIVVDKQQKTNLDGVYAAGDVTCAGMQIVTSAGDGALAAMQAMKFLRQS